LFFFFQAEDGIRDRNVTGVQTCALPISNEEVVQMQKIEKLYQIEDNHQLAEELSAYLQKAIIIENDQFELVAYSSPITQSFDPVQQKTILATRCPLYVIERLIREGIIDRLAKEDRPIRVGRMEDIHFYERIVISLKLRAQIYGYLWLYEDEQIHPNAL